MEKKQTIGKAKGITHMKVLAVAFLLAIFYIGSATFPATVNNIGSIFDNAQSDRQPNTSSIKKQIDRDYRRMLDFEHSNLKSKGTYVNLNGLMARIIGQRYMNKRVKLENGHLAAMVKPQDVTLPAIQLTKLYTHQKEKDKDFLYVLAPDQVPKYEDILPAGYKSYSNQNADDLLETLRKNDVPVLDLREEMLNEKIDHTDAFFVTDHHWKPETGFWAYTKIIDQLVQTGAMNPIDSVYTDINEYEIEVYKDFFLGSAGKRTGSYYAGVDDFSFIFPKFETDFSLELPSRSISLHGDFRDIAYDTSCIVYDYFSARVHDSYGHGQYGYKHYNNEMAPSDLKVLIIGDSFSRVPCTFLPLVFNSCNQFDMRYFEGDFEECYYEYNPDVVIVLTTPASVKEKHLTYDFFNDLKNVDTSLDDA